jgi:hypothetical protein
MRRYLLSHHGEQIAEFVEIESGKRSDRPQLQAAMALAKKRKASLLVAKLDRLSRSVAFIAMLMDSKGFDLAIADMPGANRLTRRAHTPCADRRQSPWHQARQSRAGQDQSGEGSRAGSSAAPAHRALHQSWPHIEQCHRGRSQRARHCGTEWRPMVSDAGPSRPPSSRPMIDRGVVLPGVKVFPPGRETLDYRGNRQNLSWSSRVVLEFAESSPAQFGRRVSK